MYVSFLFFYQSSPSPAALGAENLPSALNVSLPTVRTEREASSMEEGEEGEERRNQETCEMEKKIDVI